MQPGNRMSTWQKQNYAWGPCRACTGIEGFGAGQSRDRGRAGPVAAAVQKWPDQFNNPRQHTYPPYHRSAWQPRYIADLWNQQYYASIRDYARTPEISILFQKKKKLWRDLNLCLLNGYTALYYAIWIALMFECSKFPRGLTHPHAILSVSTTSTLTTFQESNP